MLLITKLVLQACPPSTREAKYSSGKSRGKDGTVYYRLEAPFLDKKKPTKYFF